MSRTLKYDWFSHFLGGRKNVVMDECSGNATSRPVKNVTDVLVALRRNDQITIRQLSEGERLVIVSVQLISTEDVCMRCVSAKFVPRLPSA